MPAFAEHRRGQAGGGGLAVGAGDRDAAAEAHQLGQHRRARHDRDALERASISSGLSRRMALDTTTQSVPSTLDALWPRITRAPSVARRRVAALSALSEPGHFVAERAQHLGNAAHAGTADADEMHAPEHGGQVAGVLQAAFARRRSCGAPRGRFLEDDVGDALGGVGPGQGARGLGHRQAARGVAGQRGQEAPAGASTARRPA
jgi:hypothetical protein